MTKDEKEKRAFKMRFATTLMTSCFFMLGAVSLSFSILELPLKWETLWMSLISALIIYMLIGWWVFAKPYAALLSSRRRLKEAKLHADRIAQFPINNPYPLFQISIEGTLLYANPAALMHFPDLENNGFLHPAASGLDTFLMRAREEKGGTEKITREIRLDGIIYHQTIIAVTYNNQQALVFYCYDITAIKHVQEKARLLEGAIIGAKDGVIITTADMEHGPEIIYVNEAFTRITGYEPEEVIGRSPKILQGPDTDKKVLAELGMTLKKGKPFSGELKNYTKDGIAYWLDINIVPVKNDKGEITHFAAIERDVTQRKAFEKELTITKEAAQVASRAKDDFLANMSHELRTPMNGIIGLTELLLDMDLREDQLELADAVHTSSRNLLILLNDILDLSKIEAGELTLENIPFDLRRAVRQTVELLSPIASRKGVVLESSINPIVPERIMGDPARLQQILNNLISNAIKFTEVGYVRVDVTSARDKAGDTDLLIRVEDSGIGIPEEKQEMVFNKFTQADVSTARKYGGTGLGLAITKELTEMMGGVISLDSVEGKGTTFYAQIPVDLAKAETAKAISKASNAINTSAKVMIVDDHPVNLLFMKKVLRKIGFTQVIEARSGREAIDFYNKDEFELIFMDCQMPEMDGFEASAYIREIEEFENKTKIIAVTADAMKGARERCIDAGMNDYISKPVDVEKLKDIMGHYLPGQHAPVEIVPEKSQAIYSTGTGDQKSIMDWERLEMFTDGDPEEEAALIDMFTCYAVESIETLKQECGAGANEEWKKAAHKLKGSAANLGAQKLSDFCYAAEKGYAEDEALKARLLENILSAYGDVTSALERHRAQVAA